MSYSSEQTRQRILDSAREEFLQKGFSSASLRTIAAGAKATTGALYNYYRNKEDLFDAVVKNTADTFLELYKETHQCPLSEDPVDASEQAGRKVLNYIYDHFAEFKIIFCNSAGTPYENYLDQLIAIEESTYRRMLGEAHPIDPFFLHVICSDGLRDLQELVSHDVPREQAEIYMAQLEKFRFAGWWEIIGP